MLFHVVILYHVSCLAKWVCEFDQNISSRIGFVKGLASETSHRGHQFTTSYLESRSKEIRLQYH